MTIKQRYEGIINYFLHHDPDPVTELRYKNPYQLLVAVMLSAQCTDQRVNAVTPVFFKSFPDVITLAAASEQDVYSRIRSISYPNSKSKHLIGMARTVIEKFNGQIPAGQEELQLLPGVGRKTANVIASVLFNVPAMAVDTHVFRVSARVGLTRNAKTPEQAERQLVKHIPTRYLSKAHHWLILHGRYVCKARKPKCDQCGISTYCKLYKLQFKQKRLT